MRVLGTVSMSTWMALAFACGDGGGAADTAASDEPSDTGAVDVTTFELTVNPITPFDQTDMFDGIASLILRVEPQAGETLEFELLDLEPGRSGQADSLPPLEDTVLTLEARDADGAVYARGVSERFSIAEGTRTIDVLMGELGLFGSMAPLDGGRVSGQLVADGTGRFLLFGGVDGDRDAVARGHNDVWAFQITPPDSALQFEYVGELPQLDDDISVRVAHTATLLTRSHDDQGNILIAGGGRLETSWSFVSAKLFLWDPTTDEAIEIGATERMSVPLIHHSAVEDSVGNVIIAGALTESGSADSISMRPTVYLYDAANRDLKELQQTNITSALMFHGAAAVSTSAAEGVLHCGGMELGDTNWVLNGACDLVATSGQITALGATGALPTPTAQHQMVALADGQVLMTGGLHATGEFNSGASLSATEAAWLFDGTSWGPLPNMNMPRALHSATLLPDGRVLIVGGAASASFGGSSAGAWTHDTPVACAEVFDPVDLAFLPLSDCSPSDTSGDLSTPVASPMVAAGDDLGVLVVGGSDPSNVASSTVSRFLALDAD